MMATRIGTLFITLALALLTARYRDTWVDRLGVVAILVGP